MQNNRIVEALCETHHDTFIGMVRETYKGPYRYAEDVVQDMYLGLLLDSELEDKLFENDGTYNRGFIYFTLKAKLIKEIVANGLVD